MSLQARLTLWSVSVMTLLVGVISVLDLTDEVSRQFESTLSRAGLVRQLTVELVYRVVDSQPKVPVRDAVFNDQRLSQQLTELLVASRAVIEIAVCDPKNIILADSDPARIGNTLPVYEEFRDLVTHTHWWDKFPVMTGRPRNFQVAEELVSSDGKIPLLSVRLVVYPELIYDDVKPALRSHAETAIASILGAMVVGFLFSTLAFRPLGQLGHMLDLFAKGEFEMDMPKKALTGGQEQNADPFGVVASKLSLLGKQLQGAQTEFSDLKGNVERLLDELEDAVLIFGRDRRLIAAAGAVERFLELPRDQMLGVPLTGIFPPGTSLGLLLSQALQTGRPVRNRRVPLSRRQSADGSATRIVPIALLTIEFLESSLQGGMLIRLRDPEASRMIGRQLQTADRLSAISQLTGGVAHEVKNPLNAIMMHVELAKMKLAHGDYDIDQQMEIIGSEILRLDRVVKTFLDFTRPVKLNLSDVGLEEFVADVADLARPQAEAAGISLTVIPSQEPVSISVDVDLLKQAVLNVMMNSIEAMGADGELRLSCAVRGDDAELRINDTGPGIPEEVRDKIYNLYFTTKKGGSGIGLAMTYRIVQLHDGTIDFTSEPGKGTTFVLRFPVAILSS